jgi:hypothetical protein
MILTDMDSLVGEDVLEVARAEISVIDEDNMKERKGRKFLVDPDDLDTVGVPDAALFDDDEELGQVEDKPGKEKNCTGAVDDEENIRDAESMSRKRWRLRQAEGRLRNPDSEERRGNVKGGDED